MIITIQNYSQEYPSSKLTKFYQESHDKARQLAKVIDAYNKLERKYKSIIQCSRQIFYIVIQSLEMLTQIGETKKIPDNIKETTTKYKAQIGRYNKIIMNDEWDEKTELMTQSVLIEHKNKLLSSKEEKKEEQVSRNKRFKITI